MTLNLSRQQFRRIAYDKLRSWIHVDDVILRHISDAVMVLDRRQRILYVNPAWEALSGYRAKDVMYQDVRRFLILEDIPKYLHIWRHVLKGDTWKGEIALKGADHFPRRLRATVSPVVNSANELSRVVIVLHRSGVGIRAIANIAHDVTNILANIRLRLSLMAKRPEKLADYLDTMEYQTIVLETLIRDLATISELQDDQPLPEFFPIQLSETVAQVIDVHRAIADSKQLTLHFEPDGTIPPVMANANYLVRIIVNLLTNALTYTPAGGQITVRTWAEVNTVVLCVRDTGIGIEPEAVDNIFDRYFRTHGARKMGKGSGLGLAIVKELVEKQRGRVVVESTPGEGTEFRVYLPSADETPTEPGI